MGRLVIILIKTVKYKFRPHGKKVISALGPIPNQIPNEAKINDNYRFIFRFFLVAPKSAKHCRHLIVLVACFDQEHIYKGTTLHCEDLC